MAKIWRDIKGKSGKFGAALSVLLASATLGGSKAYEQTAPKDNDNPKDKIEVAADVKADSVVVETLPAVEQPGTYGAYLEKLRPLEPLIIADLISKEGINVNDKGLHVPYKCSAGKWTIGFGTIALKNGKRVTANTKPITTEEAYELARYHLEKETLFLMYCYDIASDKVNVNTAAEAIAVASVIYNTYGNMIETPSKGKFVNKNYGTRFELLRNDLKKYGKDLPDSLVRQRFEEYPVEHMESFGEAWLGGKSKQEIANTLGNFLGGGTGIRWRRWMEAETLLGHVTPDMLLNCPMGGMTLFFKEVGRDRENWFTGELSHRRLNKNTIKKFREWVKPYQEGATFGNLKKTKDWLPVKERTLCESGMCKFGDTQFLAATGDETKAKNKNLAFNKASKNVRNNAHSADLARAKVSRTGKGMI